MTCGTCSIRLVVTPDLSLLVRCLAVEAAVLVARPAAVVLQDVQHARHLAEDQHATTTLLEARQQLVQQHHLAAVLRQVPVGGVGRARLGAVEQVRVVAALAQLHEDVVQAHLVATSGAVHHVDVLHQDLRVPGARRDETRVHEARVTIRSAAKG